MASTPTLDEAKDTLIANRDLGEEALYGHLDNDPAITWSSNRHSAPDVSSPAEPVAAAVSEPEPTPAPSPDAVVSPEVIPPATAPEPAPPPEPVVAAPDVTEGWSDVDKRAFEIKRRNPDLTFEEASSRAKTALDLADHDPNAPEPEPEKTTAEQLAEIETQLEEAGAAEGLLTPEIVTLQKQQARLAGQLAVENARAEDAAEVQAQQMNAARSESRDRLVALCAASGQDAQDRNSPIGKAMASVFAEMQAADHADLYAPDAPELIFVKANLRLPPEQRIAMTPVAASPAPSVQPPTPPSPAPVPPAGTPQSVLPVSPSARSAQPATVIDPAQMPRIIQEAPVEDLEKALFANGNGGVMLRL